MAVIVAELPVPDTGVALRTLGPALSGAPGTVQLPNWRKSVQLSFTSFSWMNVPRVRVTFAAVNVTGTVRVISVPDSTRVTPATFTVQALLLSGGVAGPTGTP